MPKAKTISKAETRKKRYRHKQRKVHTLSHRAFTPEKPVNEIRPTHVTTDDEPVIIITNAKGVAVLCVESVITPKPFYPGSSTFDEHAYRRKSILKECRVHPPVMRKYFRLQADFPVLHLALKQGQTKSFADLPGSRARVVGPPAATNIVELNKLLQRAPSFAALKEALCL